MQKDEFATSLIGKEQGRLATEIRGEQG